MLSIALNIKGLSVIRGCVHFSEKFLRSTLNKDYPNVIAFALDMISMSLTISFRQQSLKSLLWFLLQINEETHILKCTFWLNNTVHIYVFSLFKGSLNVHLTGEIMMHSICWIIIYKPDFILCLTFQHLSSKNIPSIRKKVFRVWVF